jgi:pimeloyl-ACP methyl ester carboxylesterase
MKDVYYGDQGLSGMVKGGFAVVATDYQGLGTQGPHQYESKTAQAFDVIYSVPAARAAVPELGRRWVADGHSQGGLAAWGVAELESDMKDDGYLGAVSVAGMFKQADIMQFLNDTPGGTFYLAYLASGIQALFPRFKPQDMLSHDAMRLYAKATTEGCWDYGNALFKDMPKSTALRVDWRENASIRQFVSENEVSLIRVNKPLLVLAGEADLTIPIDGVRQTVRRACLNGSDVTFKSYPGLDHVPTMVESMPEQLAWIKDRVEGKKSTGTCPGH